MLSKEEIENSFIRIETICKKEVCLFNQPIIEGNLNQIKRYIIHLESDKQKLIEKLEEDIKNKQELIKLEYEEYKEYYARTGGYPNQMKFNVFKLTGEKNKAEEILSILKGEK